jgi:hypothetical protein
MSKGRSKGTRVTILAEGTPDNLDDAKTHLADWFRSVGGSFSEIVSSEGPSLWLGEHPGKGFSWRPPETCRVDATATFRTSNNNTKIVFSAHH